MTKLIHLTWHPYRVPFHVPFITAHGSLSHREGVLLRLQTEEGYTGNGEIAPLPLFGGATLVEALDALGDLAKELHGRELWDILHSLEDPSMTGSLPGPLLYGLETALLDALGQAGGQSVATLLTTISLPGLPSAPRTSIAINAVIGGASTEVMLEQARAAITAGFSCLKLKITGAGQAAVERVAALRAAIGSAPRLRLDANEGWDFDQACWMLTQCAKFDIQYVEQPLPASDLTGMARLRLLSPIPLAVDESLSDPASIRLILDSGAADILILKPQLIGGLLACRKLIQEARRLQLACVITSTLETGVGVVAALHLAAASPEITLACGLATLNLLEDDLLLEPLTIRNGEFRVPPGPGLGIQPDLLKPGYYEERTLC